MAVFSDRGFCKSALARAGSHRELLCAGAVQLAFTSTPLSCGGLGRKGNPKTPPRRATAGHHPDETLSPSLFRPSPRIPKMDSREKTNFHNGPSLDFRSQFHLASRFVLTFLCYDPGISCLLLHLPNIIAIDHRQVSAPL